METLLRVLLVEDSEDDAELILRELRRGGLKAIFARVDTPEAMKEALQKQEWDVIISDYLMPRFDAMAALNVLKTFDIDIPFIVVSGSTGEDTAVAAMKAGVNDYIMKNNLPRLFPVVERECLAAQMRRDKKAAEKKLAEDTAARVKELKLINEVAMGNELKLIEREKEVNTLLKELGRPTKY
ncbi:MAG: response regulator [Candidatus Margulisbacteria bacterium]|nr:response regulator [Candidatus Margulisiibacteriota bacterium]